MELKLKLKPLYIYLIGFVIFLVAIIFFSINRPGTKMPDDAMHGKAPNDDVHKGMGMPGMGGMSEAFKQKEAELKTALDKSPNDTLKIKEYAQFLMAAHKPVDALKYLQKIVDIDPKRIDVMLNMTFIYDIQGNTAAAETLTRKILAISPNSQEANFNLAILMEKKGDKEKAKQIWNDLVKKYPNTDIAKMSQEGLDRLKSK